LKERILVLDDEPSMLDIIGQHLVDDHYDVTVTLSAVEALERLEQEDYALLISDLKMPEMHGIEVVRRAKEHDRDLAIIVVTALLEVTNAIDALRVGADDYVPKPFTLSEITLSVERALERRRLVMENRRYQEELESRVHAATADLEAANRELQGAKDRLDSGPSRSTADMDLEPLRLEFETLQQENRWLQRDILLFRADDDSADTVSTGVACLSISSFRGLCGTAAQSIRAEFARIGDLAVDFSATGLSSEKLKEQCGLIAHSVEYSTLLLRRLLEYLDIGKTLIKPVAILDVVKRLEDLLAPRLPSSVSFSVATDEASKEAEVCANAEQLMMVLQDLVDNARQALDEAGGAIELRVTADNDDVVVVVQDDGPGFPAELRPSFAKGPVPSKDLGKGIGLYLADKVLHELGGQLGLESTPGRGTAITIRLPRAGVGDPALQQGRERASTVSMLEPQDEKVRVLAASDQGPPCHAGGESGPAPGRHGHA